MTAPKDRAGVVRLIVRAIADDTPGCAANNTPCDPDCVCHTNAEEALAALEAAGLRVVPVEADDSEIDAIALALAGSTHATLAPGACWQDLARVAYEAMLAASSFAPERGA